MANIRTFPGPVGPHTRPESPDFGVRTGLTKPQSQRLGELREDVFRRLSDHQGASGAVQELASFYDALPQVRNGRRQLEPAEATCSDVLRALQETDGTSTSTRSCPLAESQALLDDADLGSRGRLTRSQRGDLEDRRRALAGSLATGQDRAEAFLSLEESYWRLGTIHNGPNQLSATQATLNDFSRLLAASEQDWRADGYLLGK